MAIRLTLKATITSKYKSQNSRLAHTHPSSSTDPVGEKFARLTDIGRTGFIPQEATILAIDKDEIQLSEPSNSQCRRLEITVNSIAH
jgi:hypothetical protein